MINLQVRALAAALACAACLNSRPSLQAEPSTDPSSAIQPTVTVQMGDVGGKFFGQTPDSTRTRHYYVAAEPEQWTFAPDISDAICGKPLPPSAAANHQPVSKLRYEQYTDATFTAKVAPTERLGILGPTLRGTVGDYLSITFLNRTAQPLSIHPHGVRYDKDSEGAYYQPNPGLGAAVGSGATFTYVWYLDESSGPLPAEPSSKAWLYHSHVTGDNEVNMGLVGCIIVTDPKRARPDGTPKDVDREMASLYLIFDESGMGADPEAYEYVSKPGGPPVKTWAEIMQLTEAGARYAINGYTFGNLPGLEMNEGERVRWYLFALGSEQDFHTAHWHGMRVIEEGRRRTDVVELLPASMKVADMLADNPGTWLLHCHVAEHMREGMFARYTVHPKSGNETSRDPAIAFLGLAPASLRIKRAELTENGGLQIEGEVTVFEAFSVFSQSVTIRMGDKTESFRPSLNGTATAENGSTFRVRNMTPAGVVYGGLLQFEITLAGGAWQEEVKKLNLKETVSLNLNIGTAAHSVTTLISKQK